VHALPNPSTGIDSSSCLVIQARINLSVKKQQEVLQLIYINSFLFSFHTTTKLHIESVPKKVLDTTRSRKLSKGFKIDLESNGKCNIRTVDLYLLPKPCLHSCMYIVPVRYQWRRRKKV
jgi:hypothetical protein